MRKNFRGALWDAGSLPGQEDIRKGDQTREKSTASFISRQVILLN